jgi:translation initiation factor 3 subunit L
MADATAIAKANEPVPDMVKQFVVYFYRHIREKNVYEILSMYEKSFGAISERYFKASAWPAVEAITKYADDDHVFCLLYREMYFRHVYGKATPSLEQRRESWDNYANLFSVILHGNVNMQLPNLWLWEMIDEFIYQFQSFCQYRGKVVGKSKDELSALEECDQKGVWAVDAVLNFLQQMVSKSDIEDVLRKERSGALKFSETEGYEYAASNVLRTLGYFSLIGISRVRILLGDYEEALKTLDPIDLDKNGLFTKVAGASVSTAYHVGFAYFMLGRYTDAARHFNTSLVFVNRHKVAATRPYSLDLLLKKQEQMYALCAMCVVLGGNGSSNGGASANCAARVLEEGVAGALREKHGDDMSRMAQGVVSAFDEAFSFACPKFVTPGGPPGAPDAGLPDAANYNEEAYRAQLKRFIAEVSSREKLPSLRSLLKLYTSISVPKLADLMDISVEELREQLEVLKRKSVVTEWRGGASALDGVEATVSDLIVAVDGDAIKTADVAPPRRNGEYFLRHIAKQNVLMEDLAPAKALVYKGKLPGQTA